jgi:CBS domain-containing protein
MSTIKDLMSEKGDSTNYTAEGTENVLQALKIMSDANISAVMITDKGKFVGIFTERDYARKIELKGLTAEGTLLRDVMTEQMMTVTPETSIEQCMKLMNQYKIRHLPVIEDNTMAGIVSMRDIVSIMLADRESTIKGLENYILSSDFNT